MIKTFDHATIYNGEYYAANTPIEVCEESPEASNNEIPEKQEAQEETEIETEAEVEAGAETEAEVEEKAVSNGRTRAGRKPKSKPVD